jgi:hypothetical protein
MRFAKPEVKRISFATDFLGSSQLALDAKGFIKTGVAE